MNNCEALIIVVGLGNIGRAVLAQLASLNQYKVIGLANSQGVAVDLLGFDSEVLAKTDSFNDWQNWPSYTSGNSNDILLDRLNAVKINEIPIVILDVSNGDLGIAHLNWLKAGLKVVTANKKPITGSMDLWRKLMKFGPNNYRFETTCGAALPVISSINHCLADGDLVTKITASPSGSLGYILSSCDNLVESVTEKLCKIILTAQKKGYTEPDPRDDLSCLDVARKTLIMARLIGKEIELNQIRVTDFLTNEEKNCSLAEFLESLNQEIAMEAMANRIKIANLNNKVVRCCGTIENNQVEVAPLTVVHNHIFSSLSGTDNMFDITCENNRNGATKKLVIRGPGAGVRITAQGVLSDLMAMLSLK